MKNIIVVLLIGIMALSFCGCKNHTSDKAADTETESVPESVSSEEYGAMQTEQISNEVMQTEHENVQAEMTASEEREDAQDTFSFENLKNKKFYFSSGAGAWATVLSIRTDGSFSGEYTDDDMGDTGEEYPNGTRYQSDFNGIFSQPVKVNDYTYSMRINKLDYEKEPKTEEIRDGVRYCYSEAYGLDHAENILLYLPNAPLSELPEEFKSWIGYYAADGEDTELSFYALNNENMQYGFSSSDLIEDLKIMLASVEERDASLENSIANDPLTQTEYNDKTKEMYDMWDSALNTVWDALKQTKDAEAMRIITAKEKEWISFKEEESKKAGADYEGGTMYSMVVNQKAAAMTKDRVYELLEMLEEP